MPEISLQEALEFAGMDDMSICPEHNPEPYPDNERKILLVSGLSNPGSHSKLDGEEVNQ